MSEVASEITLDGTRYKWVHNTCRCSGHCEADNFYVDNIPYGSIDNPALCGFIMELIDIAKGKL